MMGRSMIIPIIWLLKVSSSVVGVESHLFIVSLLKNIDRRRQVRAREERRGKDREKGGWGEGRKGREARGEGEAGGKREERGQEGMGGSTGGRKGRQEEEKRERRKRGGCCEELRKVVSYMEHIRLAGFPGD